MSSNVQLIDLREEHIEMVRQWRNSPEVGEYMYTADYITPEQQQKWYERIKSEENSKYWIIEASSKPIGLASVSEINRRFNSCYWGFYLGDSSIRGGGIGSKVEFQIISYVFDELKLNKLRGEVFTTNTKVIQLHEKFGFRREAYYRQHILKNNEYRDVVGIALLKSDWDMIKDFLRKKIYGE